jgi:hypothetical protein
MFAPVEESFRIFRVFRGFNFQHSAFPISAFCFQNFSLSAFQCLSFNFQVSGLKFQVSRKSVSIRVHPCLNNLCALCVLLRQNNLCFLLWPSASGLKFQLSAFHIGVLAVKSLSNYFLTFLLHHLASAVVFVHLLASAFAAPCALHPSPLKTRATFRHAHDVRPIINYDRSRNHRPR